MNLKHHVVIVGAFPQRPVYNKPAAERHWERLFALFGGALKGAAPAQEDE